MRPADGDPITILLATSGEVLCTVVDDYFTDGDKEEGLTWLRGHHAADSKEVAALLVARALGQQGQWIRFDVNTPTVALRGRSFQLIDGHPRDMPVIPSPTDIYALEPGFEK